MRSYACRVDNFCNEISRSVIPNFKKSYPEIAAILENWIEVKKDTEKCEVIFEKIDSFCKSIPENKINNDKDLIYLN